MGYNRADYVKIKKEYESKYSACRSNSQTANFFLPIAIDIKGLTIVRKIYG